MMMIRRRYLSLAARIYPLTVIMATSVAFVFHQSATPEIKRPYHQDGQNYYRAATSSSTVSSRSISPSGELEPYYNYYVHLDHIERVLCISDLHTDHADNLQWLANHTCPMTLLSQSKQENNNYGMVVLTKTDLIVVAGDISHDMDRMEESLLLLLRTGASVLFVAGNHEAWLNDSKDPTTIRSSMDKLEKVYQKCKDMGVYTQTCIRVGGTLECPHSLWLLPLDSWYDGSLSLVECEDLCQDFGKWPWVDFLRCQWPGYESMPAPNQKIPEGLAQYYAGQNIPLLQRIPEWIMAQEKERDDDNGGSNAVMTISHFLPNQQCLPDWKDVESPVFRRDRWLEHGGGGTSAKFAKVSGTELLDEQIRGLRQTILTNSTNSTTITRWIHLFGHSHRPKDFEYKGIRYVHNPLGKPREREIHMVSPKIDFKELWKTRDQGEVPGEKIIRYWEEEGGGLEALLLRLNNSKRKSRYGKNLKKPSKSSRKK